MASAIWIDKEKRWSLRVSINGHVRRFTSSKPGQAGKREVLKKYRDFTDGRSASPVLVVDAWSQFLDQVIERNGKTDAWINLDKYGRNYILPRIEKNIVQNLSVLDLQDIIPKAKPVSDNKKVLSRKTLLNLRAAIMQFVRFCYSAGYMEPLRGELYIPKNAPRNEKVILQPDDVRRLFEGPADSDWYLNIFRFGVVTGLRTGEIIGLQIGDIKDGILTVNRSINVRNEITPGKTATARRQIYLNRIARKIIDDTIRRNRPLQTPWIFCSRSGGPLSQSTLRNNWIRIASDRDLPGSIYSLRHTFISMMSTEIPESTLKAMIGHSKSMKTVGGVYDHIVDGQLQKAAKIIDVNFRRVVE